MFLILDIVKGEESSPANIFIVGPEWDKTKNNTKNFTLEVVFKLMLSRRSEKLQFVPKTFRSKNHNLCMILGVIQVFISLRQAKSNDNLSKLMYWIHLV